MYAPADAVAKTAARHGAAWRGAYRMKRSASPSWRRGRHGAGTWMVRPAALCFFSSTSGLAFSTARCTNATGLATAMSRLRIQKHSSRMLSAACFLPSSITMLTSRETTGSRRCAAIADRGRDAARRGTAQGCLGPRDRWGRRAKTNARGRLIFACAHSLFVMQKSTASRNTRTSK